MVLKNSKGKHHFLFYHTVEFTMSVWFDIWMKCARNISLTASVRSRSFKLGIYFNFKSKICTTFAILHW